MELTKSDMFCLYFFTQNDQIFFLDMMEYMRRINFEGIDPELYVMHGDIFSLTTKGKFKAQGILAKMYAELSKKEEK